MRPQRLTPRAAGRWIVARCIAAAVAGGLPACWPAAVAASAGAVAVAPAAPADAGPAAAPLAPPAPALAAWQARLDVQLQRGWDDPDAALAALAAMAAEPAAGPPPPRMLLLARGLVAASTGRSADAAEQAHALQALAATDALAAADAALVRAALADLLGTTATQADDVARLLAVYQRECPARDDCDPRSFWQAQLLLARQAESRGLASLARDHALAAAEAGRSAGDPLRQTWALAMAADLHGQLGDRAAEQRLLAQAMRLARLDGAPALQSRVRMFETRQRARAGDLAGARRAAEAGLALARQAGSARLAAVHLVNLADGAVKSGRPRAALQAAEQALPVLQRLGNVRAQRVLMHNVALARLALGETAAARQTVDSLRAAYRASGAQADEAQLLREFSDAFAQQGDLKSALALYHEERQLAAEIMAANRESALADLRARFDREAQQRQLDLLARESGLMSARLANRATLQKVWAGSALVLLLAGVLVALLYKRVRRINRHLAHNHAFLRAQSQRDPLTGLANRRGLQEATQAQGVQGRFTGALLLVDIDHFKHVNDGHGHAAGDAVLVDVAQRLAAAVGESDLVVRWGGEEFLVYMPTAGAPQAQALALRLLQAVGGASVPLPGSMAGGRAAAPAPAELRVTASVGYAAFPLPPAQLPVTLERAVNLVDMALYTAKGQGRNRAVGITAVVADDDEALRRTEADFDLAWQEGRLTLLRTPGPTAAPSPSVAGEALPV